MDTVPDIPVQSSLGYDIDLAAEQILQVLDEGNVVKEISSRFKFDEQIDVALRGLLTPDSRAEETDRTGTMACCDPQDFIPFFQHICIQAHLIFSYLNRRR